MIYSEVTLCSGTHLQIEDEKEKKVPLKDMGQLQLKMTSGM